MGSDYSYMEADVSNLGTSQRRISSDVEKLKRQVYMINKELYRMRKNLKVINEMMDIPDDDRSVKSEVSTVSSVAVPKSPSFVSCAQSLPDVPFSATLTPQEFERLYTAFMKEQSYKVK